MKNIVSRKLIALCDRRRTALLGQNQTTKVVSHYSKSFIGAVKVTVEKTPTRRKENLFLILCKDVKNVN